MKRAAICLLTVVIAGAGLVPLGCSPSLQLGSLQPDELFTLAGRKASEDELDRQIESWTARRTPKDVMTLMQNHGVAGALIADGRDLHQDPQLAHRGHFWKLEHQEMGVTAYDECAFRFSETVSALRPPPCLGEHTQMVCSELLGMPDEEYLRLLENGVFT